MSSCFLYRKTDGLIIILIHSNTNTCQNRCTKCCCRIRGRHYDGFSCDIGFDLCPEKRICRASHCAENFHICSCFLCHLKVVFQRKCYAFHTGTYHMSLGLGKIQSVEYALRIRIPDRGTLTGHIWKKYHSVTAWCDPFRDLIELIQRRAFFLCYRALIICKLTFKPAHDTTTSGGSSLKEPLSRNYVIAKDQSGICLVLIHADAHSAGLSSLLLCLTRMDHSSPQCSACRIQTTGNNRCSHSKAGFLRRLLCNCSHNMITGTDLRKKFHGNPKLSAHILIPGCLSHVKAMQAIALGNILAHHTRQLICNVAVRLQDLVDPLVHLREIFFIPEDLCSCVGRLKGITGYFKNLLCPDLFIQSVTDRLCSGIHPDRSVCQYISVLIHGNG